MYKQRSAVVFPQALDSLAMAPTLPPGLQPSFLKTLAVNVVAPMAAVVAAPRLSAALDVNFHLPLGVLVVLAVLSVPATYALRIQLRAMSVHLASSVLSVRK